MTFVKVFEFCVQTYHRWDDYPLRSMITLTGNSYSIFKSLRFFLGLWNEQLYFIVPLGKHFAPIHRDQCKSDHSSVPKSVIHFHKHFCPPEERIKHSVPTNVSSYLPLAVYHFNVSATQECWHMYCIYLAVAKKEKDVSTTQISYWLICDFIRDMLVLHSLAQHGSEEKDT